MVQRTVDGIAAMGNVPDAACAITAALWWWQHNELALFEFSQHRTAGHILEQTLVGAPVPHSAQLNGQPAAVPIGILGHQPTNRFDVLGKQVAPLNGHARTHGRHIT